jgi:Phytanoyl-CoA dioxygenase (PhyH)
MRNKMNNQKVTSYNVIRQNKIYSKSDIYLEEINRNGYALIKNVYTKDFMREVSTQLDSIFSKYKKLYKFDLDKNVIRCPLAYSKDILDLSINNKILSLVKDLLGANFVLLMQNAVINKHNLSNYQANWHRDLNYQHWTSSEILALNFLVCVDKFYCEGGCSWVIPGSHMFDKFPSIEYIKKFQRPIEADIGSVIIMNAMTYHRSGINITKDFTRRAINHVIGKPFMSQQISIPKTLKDNNQDYSHDPFLNKYFGYKWNTSDDIKSWIKCRK